MSPSETVAPKQSADAAKLLAFSFNARHKSNVPSVFALEARRLKRLFSRKPKVSLHELEAALKDSASPAHVGQMMPTFVEFYSRSDSGPLFFEAAGRLLLEAASKEKEDGERQGFLLREATEVLTLAIQKSPKVLNLSAQSLLVSIFRIMGSEAPQNYYVEKEIHKEMLTMINVKRDPSDFASREKIIKLYVQERNFYEALVHIGEYEKLMQARSRSLYRQKKGDIAFRKAGIFQVMLDHYNRLTSGKELEGVDRKAEMRKLNAFVARFNRDNRVNIIPLKNLDNLSLHKTLNSMVSIAKSFYGEATQSEHFQHKHKAYFFMARNNFQFDNQKAALHNLAEGIRLLTISPLPQKQKIPELLKLLEFQEMICTDQGHQRKADETKKEIARLRQERRGSGSSAATPEPDKAAIAS